MSLEMSEDLRWDHPSAVKRCRLNLFSYKTLHNQQNNAYFVQVDDFLKVKPDPDSVIPVCWCLPVRYGLKKTQKNLDQVKQNKQLD